VNVWRRAAIGLIAGAATALAAMPAPAVAGRPAVTGTLGAKPAAVRATAPTNPRPAHHHRVVAHAPATTNTNPKRACGPAAAMSAPAVRVVAAVASVPSVLLSTERRLRVGTALAARAPPAGQ